MAEYKMTCEYCGARIAGGSWDGGLFGRDGDRRRYLKHHQQRCEGASEKDRAYFREHGRWPRKKRKRSRQAQ